MDDIKQPAASHWLSDFELFHNSIYRVVLLQIFADDVPLIRTAY